MCSCENKLWSSKLEIRFNVFLVKNCNKLLCSSQITVLGLFPLFTWCTMVCILGWSVSQSISKSGVLANMSSINSLWLAWLDFWEIFYFAIQNRTFVDFEQLTLNPNANSDFKPNTSPSWELFKAKGHKGIFFSLVSIGRCCMILLWPSFLHTITNTKSSSPFSFSSVLVMWLRPKHRPDVFSEFLGGFFTLSLLFLLPCCFFTGLISGTTSLKALHTQTKCFS